MRRRRLTSIGPGDTLAGLFIDEWSESIPATVETTGLGFHFDAPGRTATAEHSSGCAVANPTVDSWTLDGLVDVVNEAMALARLRAVRPPGSAGTRAGAAGHLPVQQLQAGRADGGPAEDARVEPAVCSACQWAEQRRELHEDGRRQPQRSSNRESESWHFEFQRPRRALRRSPPSSPSRIRRPRRGRGSNRCRPVTTCRRRCRRGSPIRCGCWRASGSSTSSRVRTRAARSRRPFASAACRSRHSSGTACPRVALAGAPPIEALVEREQVLAVHPKLNAQAGQQLMRQLRAAGLERRADQAARAFSSGDRARRRIRSATTPASSGTHCSTASRSTRWRSRTTLRPLLGNDAALDGFGTDLGRRRRQLPTFADSGNRLDGTGSTISRVERRHAGREPVLERASARVRVRAAGRRHAAAAPARSRRVHRRPARLAHLHRRAPAQRAGRARAPS